MKSYASIRTRYRGPTDVQGSRVVARTISGRLRGTFPWRHELGPEENHLAAAQEMARRAELGPVVGRTLMGHDYIWLCDRGAADEC